MENNNSFDIAVIGAGFSGSLTALGLHQLGYNVLLLEKGKHPRFTIGESSTPIANLILRDLSRRYDLPWLRDLSCYGSWKNSHPEISCGLKRGFSYYKHHKGKPFKTGDNHANELLVAASANNEHSDTNWYRSEVDAFFAYKVKESGVTYCDNTTVSDLSRANEGWKIITENAGQSVFKSDWVIDASGSGVILELLGVNSDSRNYRTNTSALFSHFTNVKPWHKHLQETGISTEDYPYNPDHSALHHILNEGWLWMLRFDNNITSCGVIFDRHKAGPFSKDDEELWDHVLKKYPSIAKLFSDSELAATPDKLILTNRLQRGAEQAAGDRWVALPHSAGFIDPLHSTGIAHSLSGVEQILYAFEKKHRPKKIQQSLNQYREAVFEELHFIDLLVAGSYRAMNTFELFNAYTMLYFIAAINYEQLRITGNFDIESDYFLSANNETIRTFTASFYERVLKIQQQSEITESDLNHFREDVKKAIRPFNKAGLLHPDVPNMYRHTAATF